MLLFLNRRDSSSAPAADPAPTRTAPPMARPKRLRLVVGRGAVAFASAFSLLCLSSMRATFHALRRQHIVALFHHRSPNAASFCVSSSRKWRWPFSASGRVTQQGLPKAKRPTRTPANPDASGTCVADYRCRRQTVLSNGDFSPGAGVALVVVVVVVKEFTGQDG